MAENGFLVVGSRPPSRMDSRCGSALSTRHQIEGTSDLETPKTPSFSKFRNPSYEDELFGRINAVVADHKQIERLTGSTKKTYGKELLSGTLPTSKSQQDAGRSVLTMDRPPSGLNRTQPKGTDPKIRNTQTRTGINRYTVQSTHTPSYVDETLFGSPPDEASWPAPWDKQSARKPPIFVFDGTDYRNTQARSIQNRSQSSTNHSSERDQRSGSRPASAKTKYRPPTIVHRESYVDETLFGDRPFEAEWPAPWEKQEARNKPLLFDASDHRVTAKHRDPSALNATNKRDAQAKRIGANGHPHTKQIHHALK